MGGAASLLQRGVAAATEEELANAVKDVPDEVWAKLVAARKKAGGAEPQPKKESKEECGGGDSTPPEDEFAKATLVAHNELRAKHGAPPLEWSEECFALAAKQAAAMQEKNSLFHDNMNGTSGKHGQNCFMGTGKTWTAMDATKSWYDELTNPGYDFAKQGFTSGTGHFTQVVWLETRYVGMARSANGNFIAANYLPAGNMDGQFEKNVFPTNTAMKKRAPEPRIGEVTATEWTADVAFAFAGCPFDEMELMAKQAFADGNTVVIDRQKSSIKITIKRKDGAFSTREQRWGC